LRVAPVPPKPVPNEPTTSGLPGVNIGQTVVPVPSEPGTDPLTTQSVAKAHQPGEPVALTSESDVSPAAQATDAELSEWVIQISSQRSPEDAQAAYNNLRNRFPNLLEDRHVAIVKADLPGKGIFYRVRVGSQSKEDATDFCQRLQSAGGACFVTR
jgi:cell division septation protein DedD